ncbi:site-specific recombinase [Methanomassiliicoccales archaeon RumEn M1]|jgi:site-specific DNA recombinase|nr:site-specific recombinase [Methanomassiliicoccales archaeon RumEn M1]
MYRVAIYTRVSTDDQAEEGYSLEAQMERLEAYCEAQGWEVAGRYVDEGFTGRSTRRPAYQRMMQEREKWDAILVMKMDRIHRNSKNFMIMMENLEKWGKKFSSMQEELDTSSAMGRFVVDIIQRIAQLESEQIGERTYSGMAQKAETGGMLGFYPPFGYLVKDNDMVIVEEEAMVVRELFSRYCEGETMAALAESLNERGLRTRRGQQWTLYSIRHILHNPAYAGYRRWDGILVKSQHPSIIDVQTFNAAQVVAAERTKDPRFKSAKMLPA